MTIKWAPASQEELARRVSTPAAVKPAVRAREDDGKFRGDDPKTADVNEAWETPKLLRRGKKSEKE